VVAETNESNNIAYKQGYRLVVTEYSPQEQPDLYDQGESHRSFDPRTFESGKPDQTITIESTIKNGGTTSSPVVMVAFYASTDTDITASDYKLGQSGNLPALDPGQSQSFTAMRELPINIPPGTYYIGWIIDVDNVADESDESNNTAVIQNISLVLQDPEDGDGSILYVDSRAQGANDGSSWENAYRSLQDALNLPVAPYEIHVAQGVYKPDQGAGISPRDQAASFQLKSDVKVKGGYAGYGAADPNARDVHTYKTILSGDLEGNDVDVADPCDLLDEMTRDENSYHVVNASGTNATAELDGFIIEAGNANEAYPENGDDTGHWLQHFGGGLVAGEYRDQSQTPPGNLRIINCTFQKNSALQCGGGIYTHGGSPEVNGCTFESNYAGAIGGGMYCSGEVSITDCVFAHNAAQYSAGGLYYTGTGSITDCAFNNNDGRGLYIEGNGSTSQLTFDPMVTGCLFSDNKDGGISVAGGNPILISNCIFQHNQSSSNGGGMYSSDSSFSEVPITLVNCVFRLNEVEPNPQTDNMALGGAIYVDGCTLNIINCTFYMNDADHGDAISALRSISKIRIYNSILWDYDDEIYGGTVSVEHSCLRSRNVPGVGNTSEDPRFVDPPFDLHLIAGSPCIDAGDNSVVNSTGDLDGNPRRVDDLGTPDTGNGDQPLVDMGAYEYQGYGPEGCIIYVDKEAPGLETGESWYHAFHTLQDALEIAYPGCEIRIGQGTYKPDEGREATPGDRQASFHLKNGVVIDGGYAGYGVSNPDAKAATYRAVLSGDLLGNETSWGHSMDIEEPDKEDNSYHVVVGDETNGSAMLRNCVIKHGHANGISPYWANGGALINYHGSPTVEGCLFYGNTSRISGGAVCNWGSGADFKYCTFEHNYCSGQGGAMWNYGPDAYNSSDMIMITTCQFVFNIAKQNGGAMDNWSYCRLSNCEFSSNSAEYEDGGAIRIHGSNNTLYTCTFANNQCNGQGGAIHVDALHEVNVYEQIEGCTFSQNQAKVGGGVSIFKGHQVSMTGCLFQKNKALSYGAGISANELQILNLTNCEFRDNTSNGDGGGLWQACSGETDMINCIFVGNKADQKGGGIYWLRGDLTLTNCTLNKNDARFQGDGIFMPATLTKPSLRATNCILWNGSEGTLVLESGGLGFGYRNISFSCVEQTNLAGLGVGNMTANPLFSEDGRNGNVHLTRSSPCIDAGDNSAVPAWITTDLDNNPRIVDGGKGEPPIVDMGAYEYEKQPGGLWPMPYDPTSLYVPQ
jgi:predicted outer membrane repeat protein